jgi:hypothetical protein
LRSPGALLLNPLDLLPGKQADATHCPNYRKAEFIGQPLHRARAALADTSRVLWRE